MKFWIRIVVLTLIDFILIWLWVKQIDPDPSISILTIFLVPVVITTNLLIALLLYYTKREFAKIFVANSLIAGFLMFYLFDKGIERHQNARLESWEFSHQDTIFRITHWKLNSTFTISESKITGSSTQFLQGFCSIRENAYYLTTDSTEYIIKNDYLYQFRNLTDSIQLTKVTM